jgi:glycosidase
MSPVSPIRGLIDFHTHAAPDVFGRSVDDDELASQAAARQMEAVVFRSVGAQHFVLGTDLGQTGNPTPADGLMMFVAGLEAAGITGAQIQTMGREVPGALLMG